MKRVLNHEAAVHLMPGLADVQAEVVPVSSLDISKTEQGRGRPMADKSVGDNLLTIAGKVFAKGLGTCAPSVLYLDLKGTVERFTASVGIDDETADVQGCIEFRVYGDGRLLWKSGAIHAGDEPLPVDLSLSSIKTLILAVYNRSNTPQGSHADWADAQFFVNGAHPETIAAPTRPGVILTPKPGPAPRINGPKIFGVRPGSAFLYTIPATGNRPLTFAADGLPKGLLLDPATGQITGTLSARGEYQVTLRASNTMGESEKPFRIVVGDAIALTPPMGWNSWNCWGGAVSQEKVANSARAMLDKGLRDHGWTYVNVDDGWQGVRGGPLRAIQPNSKFPDMRALGEQIHAMGLKFGIYSTPWRGTYEGHIGSSCDNEDGTYDWIQAGDCNEFFRIASDAGKWNKKRRSNYAFGKHSFVDKDAAQFGQWAVDYLKYDWLPNDVESTSKMAEALRASGRDIVYSLSNEAPFDHSADLARLSNAWRTTADITDTWPSMSGIGFHQCKWAPFAGPGHWNDPDMLVVGDVGWGHPHPTRLTPDEQYTHISLWCLLSAPLLIGCNLDTLDDFTIGLLTNDEVLEVDQDSLGQQAIQIARDDRSVVYAKHLDDGSCAVGLFNIDLVPHRLSISWSELELTGPQNVRDLWRQLDLGKFETEFSSEVPPHGVILVRVIPPNYSRDSS
jgi:alpha-galactosidase